MSYNAPPPPPPNAPPPPLPPGWRVLQDQSGRPYFHNTVDGAVSWTPPFAPPPPPPSAPPPAPPPGPPPGQPLSSHPPLGHHLLHQPTSFSGPTQSYPTPPYGSHVQPPSLPWQNQSFANAQPSQPPSAFSHPSAPPAPHFNHPSLTPAISHVPSHAPVSSQPYPYAQQAYPSAPPVYPPTDPSVASPTYPPVAPSPSYQPSTVSPYAPSMGPPSAEGSVYVSLEMKAVGLRDRDFIGKSDPVCHVSIPQPPRSGPAAYSRPLAAWKRIGSTEVLGNTLAPNWARRVKIAFHFERHQPIRFTVVDVDNKKTLKGDALGYVDTTLADIVRNGLLKLKLMKSTVGKPGSFGELIVRAHDDSLAGKARVNLALSGSKLDKKDKLSNSSDPYYVVKQVVGLGSSGTSTLFKSKELSRTCDPVWEPHTLLIQTDGKPWREVQLHVTVFDWDRFTPHDLIGEASFSLADLTTSPHFALINPKKVGKRKYTNSGLLKVLRADAADLPSFTSFLQGGLRLNFIVAIDFTASNRPVNNPISLHYMGDPQKPSQYHQALHAVGTILSGYTPDGYITALGFGAILPGQGGQPSFDFSLSGQADARVRGVQGLLSSYAQAANNVTLAGPTYFAPLIRNAMSQASAYPVTQTNQHFSVLLILTDGAITDLPATKDAIIECSYNTPMAIVIVGIGDANFKTMEELDGDQKVLRSTSGREAKHDIVQFTQFDRSKSIDVLSADILQEVPQRIVEYMVDAGIRPNPPSF